MQKKSAFIDMLLSIMTFASCKKEMSTQENNENKEFVSPAGTPSTGFINTFYGPQVNVGNGKIRSWIRIDHDEKPFELGLEITPGALENLPHEEEEGIAPHWDIPVHQKLKDVTAFDHLNVNWNPHGHPDPFFGAQHFDFHFYMMTKSDRMAIPTWSPATDALFNNYPPAGYMPANYSVPPGATAAVAGMGKHWLPPPPTFMPFTHVMILGSYDGHFNFIEPMVTLNYLLSGQSVSKDYSQPLKFENADYYPTKYNVWKDANTGHHFVSLSHFVWRNAH